MSEGTEIPWNLNFERFGSSLVSFQKIVPTKESHDIMEDDATPTVIARRRQWLLPVVVIGAAAVGVAARFLAFFAPRSLWLDEAMLACNICGRSALGLLRPLDDNQAAPVGFLLMSHLSVETLGVSEAALRLIPLLAALASLAMVYWLCRKKMGRVEAALGTGLAAVMPAMIYYGAEAKQYAVDLAVGLLVPALAAPALRDGLSARRAAVLAVIGAMTVWFSHPSLFVLAAAGLVLIVGESKRSGFRASARAVAVSACWAASFLACYALTMRNLRGNDFLDNFWQAGFLAVPPRSSADARQYVTVTLGVFEAMYQNYQARWGIEGRMAVLAASAWLAGVLVLIRRRDYGFLAMMTLPLILALAASAIRAYPMRVRMTLFVCGPNVVVMAAGLGAAWRSSSSTSRSLGVALSVGLFLLPAVLAVSTMAERTPHGARPVLA